MYGTLGNGQGFGWHEDALAEEEATLEAGRQRIATLWYILMIVKMDQVEHCFVIYVKE